MSMSSTMPQIMDIIRLTACKTLSVDPKEAMTALSVYLKNTSTRASAKRHRQKFEISGRQNVQLDTSVENGSAQPAITHSEGRQATCNFHSGGTDPVESSDSEESQSVLGLQELSDYSDTE